MVLSYNGTHQAAATTLQVCPTLIKLWKCLPESMYLLTKTKMKLLKNKQITSSLMKTKK